MKKIGLVLVVAFAGLSVPAVGVAQSGPAGGRVTPQGVVREPLALGDPAPELAATDLEGRAVTLGQFRGTPVVLQFGSLTDPIFRLHVPAVEKLATTYGPKAAFLVVYQREAHAAGMGDDLEVNVNEAYSIAAPASQEERRKLAAQAVTRLHIAQQKVLVDVWNNTTALRYGGLANMTFLIDAQGKLAAAYPWMDVKKLDGALGDILAGKPVDEAHRGPVRTSGAAVTTVVGDDALGPARFAAVIDNLHLTDEQRDAVYPILADFVTEIRTLREQRVGQAAGIKAATTQTKTAAPMAPGEIFAKVRAATDRFKTRLKPLLNDEQYGQLVEGLNRPFGGKKKL